MKTLTLIHNSGRAYMLQVEWANVRPSRTADGFDVDYKTEGTDILFLRTENFDGVIVEEVTEP